MDRLQITRMRASCVRQHPMIDTEKDKISENLCQSVVGL